MVNSGTVGTYAQVVYDVYDKVTGAKVATLKSQVVWIDPTTSSGDATFASDPWASSTGIYSVVATLVFGADPANLNLVDGVKQLSRFVVL